MPAPVPLLSNEAIVLASGSATRAAMLRQAGLAFEVDVPGIDEAELQASLRAERASGREIAEALAELKALRVSARSGPRLVLAGDQTLTMGDRHFDKPKDLADAAQQLAELSGKVHELASAAVIARNGAVIWRKVETARLTMRALSREFIARYLDAAGPQVLQNVGAYALEGLGVQLFSRIEGDHFTVLGLPLLPVLDFLRVHRVVP